MAQTIQVKRGLKLNIPTLISGEMGFCTDTKEVFVGDGTGNILVGRAMMGTYAARPNAGVQGRLYYVNSSTNLGYVYIDDGIAWQRANVLSLSDLTGTLDDIAEGTTYAKVKKTDITNGQVNKISDGANTITASEAKTHINDATKHRFINDSGTAVTDLWSAQKVANELALAKQGMEYQDSVKDKDLLTPPASPVIGDRYIVAVGTGVGAWLNNNNKIAVWNGSAWAFITPTTGMSCIVDDESKQYTYNGAIWVRTGGVLQTVTAGNGLTGGGQADSVTLNIGAGLGMTVNADDIAVKAYKGITVDVNGVAVNIDGTSIAYDATNGNRLTVATVDGGTF
jgi:hypothetical protein